MVYRVHSTAYGLEDKGYRTLGIHRVQGIGYMEQGMGCRMWDVGCRVQGVEHSV